MHSAGRDRGTGLSLNPQQLHLEGFSEPSSLHSEVEKGPKGDQDIVGEHLGPPSLQEVIAELIHLGVVDLVDGCLAHARSNPDAPMSLDGGDVERTDRGGLVRQELLVGFLKEKSLPGVLEG